MTAENSPKYAKKAVGAFSTFGKRLKFLGVLSGKIFAKFFMPKHFLANRKLLKSLHRQVPIFATLKGEKILAHFFAPNFSPSTLGTGQIWPFLFCEMGGAFKCVGTTYATTPVACSSPYSLPLDMEILPGPKARGRGEDQWDRMV